MEGLAVGRIVHYVSSDTEFRCRPALVLHVWSEQGTVNLAVFPDGLNDAGGGDRLWWRTSVTPQAPDDPALRASWHPCHERA